MNLHPSAALRDPNMQRKWRAGLLKEFEAAMEAGKIVEAAKILGVPPRSALRSRSSFKSAVASQGIDWSPSWGDRYRAYKDERLGGKFGKETER